MGHPVLPIPKSPAVELNQRGAAPVPVRSPLACDLARPSTMATAIKRMTMKAIIAGGVVALALTSASAQTREDQAIMDARVAERHYCEAMASYANKYGEGGLDASDVEDCKAQRHVPPSHVRGKAGLVSPARGSRAYPPHKRDAGRRLTRSDMCGGRRASPTLLRDIAASALAPAPAVVETETGTSQAVLAKLHGHSRAESSHWQDSLSSLP